MAWSLFKSAGNSDNLLTKADTAVAAFEEQKLAMEKEKEQKMQRQVELWSILTPSEELKTEYRQVAGDVAFLVKKMLCIDEHLKQLKLARYKAQNGDNKRLQELLTVEDPCSNVTAEVPQVSY